MDFMNLNVKRVGNMFMDMFHKYAGVSLIIDSLFGMYSFVVGGQ